MLSIPSVDALDSLVMVNAFDSFKLVWSIVSPLHVGTPDFIHSSNGLSVMRSLHADVNTLDSCLTLRQCTWFKCRCSGFRQYS